MSLTLNFDYHAFYSLGDSRLFHSKIYDSLLVMTLPSKSGVVSRRSSMYWHTCMCQYVVWQLQYYLRADLPHARIFGDNLPDVVAVHAQLTCDKLNSQPTIATYHLPHASNVGPVPAHWRPSTPGVIFHVLAPFFEPLVPLENPGARHHHAVAAVVWVHLSDQKPPIGSLLCAHRL